MNFAHITDTQLGYAQYGLASRAKDFDAAFVFCVDEALIREVDAVVFGGDLFEMPKPAAAHVELVQEQVRRLRSVGIDVLGVEGNHDHSAGKWLAVCGIHDLEAYPFVCQGVGFAGLGYRRDNMFLSDLAMYASNCQTGINVMVLHQSLLEYAPFTSVQAKDIVQLLKPKGLRHMAMGHIHAMHSLEVDGVSIVCPGSTEMTDINEPREKYFAITEVIPGQAGPASTELVRIPTRPIMHYIVETEDELEKVCGQLPSSNASILVAAVSTRLVDGRLRLEDAANKSSVPYRLTSFNPDNAASIKVGESNWDRARSVVDLIKYVDRSFPDSASDKHGLVSSILAAPANCADIMSSYINTKLKELGYAK